MNLFNCPAETIPQIEYSNIQLYLTHKVARPTGNPALPELLSGYKAFVMGCLPTSLLWGAGRNGVNWHSFGCSFSVRGHKTNNVHFSFYRFEKRYVRLYLRTSAVELSKLMIQSQSLKVERFLVYSLVSLRVLMAFLSFYAIWHGPAGMEWGFESRSDEEGHPTPCAFSWLFERDATGPELCLHPCGPHWESCGALQMSHSVVAP